VAVAAHGKLHSSAETEDPQTTASYQIPDSYPLIDCSVSIISLCYEHASYLREELCN